MTIDNQTVQEELAAAKEELLQSLDGHDLNGLDLESLKLDELTPLDHWTIEHFGPEKGIPMVIAGKLAPIRAAARPRLSALAEGLEPLQGILQNHIRCLPTKNPSGYPKFPSDYKIWDRNATPSQRKVDRRITFKLQHDYLQALAQHLGTFNHLLRGDSSTVHRRSILTYSRIIFDAAAHSYYLFDPAVNRAFLRCRAVNLQLKDFDANRVAVESELKQLEQELRRYEEPVSNLVEQVDSLRTDLAEIRVECEQLKVLAIKAGLHLRSGRGGNFWFDPSPDDNDYANWKTCIPNIGSEGIALWSFLSGSIHVVERPLAKFTMGLEGFPQDVHGESYTFLHLTFVVVALLDSCAFIINRVPLEGVLIPDSYIASVMQLMSMGSGASSD